jgi:hypothetical protein
MYLSLRQLAGPSTAPDKPTHPLSPLRLGQKRRARPFRCTRRFNAPRIHTRRRCSRRRHGAHRWGVRSEVAVMGSLTSNLHFLMASFYRPNKDRWKILIEGRRFPVIMYEYPSLTERFRGHQGLTIMLAVCCRVPDKTSWPQA